MTEANGDKKLRCDDDMEIDDSIKIELDCETKMKLSYDVDILDDIRSYTILEVRAGFEGVVKIRIRDKLPQSEGL